MRVLALAFIAFSGLDCVTTGCALSLGDREENPVIASLYMRDGVASLFVVRAVLVAAVLIGLSHLPRRVAAWAAWAFTAITALVVVSNVLTITHH